MPPENQLKTPTNICEGTRLGWRELVSAGFLIGRFTKADDLGTALDFIVLILGKETYANLILCVMEPIVICAVPGSAPDVNHGIYISHSPLTSNYSKTTS